ncbi:Glycerophosphoryl diester phosphodiesterase family protein [Aquiflexum balticum DSM 16537]|uniref:Glycerophosphoryl diester phosphodiesterase family protein n=1 Tax=Aquiflexum balticum DSM 16537 TaxID=758820 RepID=A0A1W2GYC1_9BACT|nr:phosphatidylinositol-specific phospholipase C/glycerophosphodiester phosphodiesterase family protein [Aquiflexum balticum]SMD41554.1 Glycerophosphoryl diester phosphodiesterase family protein [Aquiflexum balticum DSM 16537]
MKKILFLILCSFLVFQFSIAQERKSFKLHSHNDYLRKVPFWEAFGADCASIEADVILQDGELMVAHERATIKKERTLKSLYLAPIQKAKELSLVDEFGFHLMIDIKTEAYATLELLVKQLKEFEPMLYSPANQNGLKIIVSGNRPKVEDYNDYPSWILFDYQSRILNDQLPWGKIGMVSLNFRQFSVWNGEGSIVEREKEKLISFIQQVHNFGKPVRFWGTPDSQSAWKAFYDLGIDYINTDMPYEADQYLSNLDKNF